MNALPLALLLLAAPPAVDGADGALPAVQVVNDELGSRLLVDGRPMMLRGMNWDAVPVGENYAWSLWDRPDDEVERVLRRDMALLRDMLRGWMRAAEPQRAAQPPK